MSERKILFESGPNQIVVFSDAGNAPRWSGQYHGCSIKNAIPLNEGETCILLLDPDAVSDKQFRNLLCIDDSGRSSWIAELPSSPDVFVNVKVTEQGVVANTWSGFMLVLGKRSGKEINRKFVK